MAGNCGQPLGPKKSPPLAASKKSRTSTLKQQELNSANSYVGSEEDLELRKERSLADILTTAL